MCIVCECMWTRGFPWIPSILKLVYKHLYLGAVKYETMLDVQCPEMLKVFESLPRMRHLYCVHLGALTRLPELPVLLILNCSGCTDLIQLPEMPVLERLNCSECTALMTLPNLPSLRELICDDCLALKSLPDLPLLERLYCSGCTLLAPNLPPSLRYLRCSGCLGFRKFPRLPLLEVLNCSGCASLADLGELPSLKDLNCRACVALEYLPEMPALMILYMRSCTALKTAPVFPSLQYVFVMGPIIGALIGNIPTVPTHSGIQYIYVPYTGPCIGKALVRIMKTMRQRRARLTAERYLRSPDFRELTIEFYKGKIERDKARLEKWLKDISLPTC